jgi:hypothetical protein
VPNIREYDSRDGGGRRMSDQSHDSRDEATTVTEAARILGITEGAVRKHVERGNLAADHTGRRVPGVPRPRHGRDRHDTRPTATAARPQRGRRPLHPQPGGASPISSCAARAGARGTNPGASPTGYGYRAAIASQRGASSDYPGARSPGFARGTRIAPDGRGGAGEGRAARCGRGSGGRTEALVAYGVLG